MVIWTPRARTDLKAIYEYIVQDAPQNAKRIVQEIVQKADILVNLPNLGKVTPEIEDPLVREISAYSWRIIYHLRDGNVYVLTVVHKRRQLDSDEITTA